MLMTYLRNYTARVKPLLDQSEEMDKVKQNFDAQWDTGTFPGWPVSRQLS